jgi:1-acyl-sn-glycerol-3-phosphate acyltransferase
VIAAVRIVVIFCYFLFVCIFGCLFSMLRPFHPNNVRWVSQAMGKVAGLLGVEVEVRVPDSVKSLRSCVYVANHQNSLDLFLIASGVQPYTVTVGKKSLRWIPFFGQLYWFSGNILIDRDNRGKAFNTISQTVSKIKERGISVWMFAEGTRSYGRGLLPFKTGAFHTAIQAEVPIVPLCMSTTHNMVKLNRWNNGKVIIEIMDPWEVNESDKAGVRDLAEQVRGVMKQKIDDLDNEIKQ